MAELIFEDRKKGLTIHSHSRLSAQMADLVAATVWGSGGTQYQIRDFEAKLDLLPGLDFITLELDGRIAGFYVLSSKRVSVGDASLKAYYRTLLTVVPEFRRLGYGSLLAQHTRRHYLGKLDGQGLVYGYIEADNLHSLDAVTGAGYQPIASFQATIFSRARPRFDPRCRLLDPSGSRTMQVRLTELYRGHVLQDFDQSLAPGCYWVLEHGGCVVAGVQVEICDWRIRRLPGIGGALLVHLISRVPVLRNWFNAFQCRFAKFGNLYAKSGEESEIFSLFESVLAHHELKAAMIFQDPRSPVFQRFSESGRFGLLDSGIDAKVYVVASMVGLTAEQERQLYDQPVLISPRDFT